MQYTISMTTRMLAIAALCAFLLCVLLFLLGIELGKRFAEPGSSAPLPALPAIATPALPTPTLPALPTPAMPAVAAPSLKP